MRLRPLTTIAAAALASACSFHFRGDDSDFFENLAHATKEESAPLALAAGGTLQIDGTSGDVRVRVDATSAPRVDALWTARAKQEEEAHALLERCTLEVEKSGGGDRPTIHVAQKSSDPSVAGSNSFFMHAEADLTFTIPADVTLKIATRYGDVAVDGPVRAVTIDAPHGDVRVVDAQETRVTSSSGKIHLERIRGRVEASSQYDSVEIEDAEGPVLHARSRSGGVRLRDARADRVELESSYDDVTLDRVAPLGRKLEVTATTSSGDVVARDVDGELEASNRSGTIRIERFHGELRASSEYGDVSIEGRLSELDAETGSGKLSVLARSGSRVEKPWRIETRYGDVRLDLPGDLDADLDAASGYGKISGDFDVKISGGAERGRAHAKLGAGGRPINVTSSNGEVRVLRR